MHVRKWQSWHTLNCYVTCTDSPAKQHHPATQQPGCQNQGCQWSRGWLNLTATKSSHKFHTPTQLCTKSKMFVGWNIWGQADNRSWASKPHNLSIFNPSLRMHACIFKRSYVIVLQTLTCCSAYCTYVHTLARTYILTHRMLKSIRTAQVCTALSFWSPGRNHTCREKACSQPLETLTKHKAGRKLKSAQDNLNEAHLQKTFWMQCTRAGLQGHVLEQQSRWRRSWSPADRRWRMRQHVCHTNANHMHGA